MEKNEKSFSVKVSGVLMASPARVYEILRDYETHHPQILPKRYFKKILVEEGGIGEGTKLFVEMAAIGFKKAFQCVIAEPVPGHILEERMADGSSTTTFTVSPASGTASLIVIETVAQKKPGMLGGIEAAITNVFLSHVYAEEIELLRAYLFRLKQPNQLNLNSMH